MPTSMVQIASLQVILRQYPKETASMTTRDLRLNGFENHVERRLSFRCVKDPKACSSGVIDSKLIAWMTNAICLVERFRSDKSRSGCKAVAIARTSA